MPRPPHRTKVITLAHYLDLFTQQSLELLNRGRRQGSYRHTVDTTWDLSLQRLRQETPAATGLLNLLAFVAPDDFPWQLLASHVGQLPDAPAGAAGDEVTLAEVIGALRRYSLIKVTVMGYLPTGWCKRSSARISTPVSSNNGPPQPLICCRNQQA